MDSKGTGMSTQNQSRLFDAFFTTKPYDSNPNYHYSREFGVPFYGAGFGLFKSKLYLDFHGLSIHMESIAGEGTTFLIK